MCTVSFVPGLAGGGFVLATNRDESHRRGPARPPSVFERAGRRIIAPRDADAGGTWVAGDDHGHVLCLLNGDGPGASPPRADAPSRGLLVLELMHDPRPAAVRAWLEQRAASDELNYRAFKLLVAAPGEGHQPAGVARIDWDGATLSGCELDGASVAISSTFEREAVSHRRSVAFADFVRGLNATAEGDGGGLDAHRLSRAVTAWHAGHTPGEPQGDAYSVCMHREDARTVSCTVITVSAARVAVDYQAGWPCAGGPVVREEMPRRFP